MIVGDDEGCSDAEHRAAFICGDDILNDGINITGAFDLGKSPVFQSHESAFNGGRPVNGTRPYIDAGCTPEVLTTPGKAELNRNGDVAPAGV